MTPQETKFLREDFPALLKKLANPMTPQSCTSESRNFIKCLERCKKEKGSLPNTAAKNQAVKLKRLFGELKQLETVLFQNLNDAIRLTQKAQKRITDDGIPFSIQSQAQDLGHLTNMLKGKEKELQAYRNELALLEPLYDLASKGKFDTMNAGFAKNEAKVKNFVKRIERWRDQLRPWPTEILRWYPKTQVPFVEEYEIEFKGIVAKKQITPKTERIVIALMMTADQTKNYQGLKKILISETTRTEEEQAKLMYINLQKRRKEGIDNPYYEGDLADIENFFLHATMVPRTSIEDIRKIYEKFKQELQPKGRPDVSTFETLEQPKQIEDKIIEFMTEMVYIVGTFPHKDNGDFEYIDISRNFIIDYSDEFDDAIQKYESNNIIYQYTPPRAKDSPFHIGIRK